MGSRDLRRASRRTPLACQTCRRRKTKCDGVRPRCRHCAARGSTCSWPSTVLDAGPPLSPHPARRALSPDSSASVTAQVHLPSRQALRRCFELFFARHFTTDFCSFDYRPDLEANYDQKSFLVLAIVSLCSRYLSSTEAMDSFGLSPREVGAHYTRLARRQAKELSDMPSVAHIQGFLVLATSELLLNAGSRHWMYAGTAIRMAQIMRLNGEFHQQHSLKEQEMRRRTFWACLVLDRALASLLAKPHALATDSIGISIALPSPDASLGYQEGSRGLTLASLGAFRGHASDVGLLPYLIKTVHLWSDLADWKVGGHRSTDPYAPTDPRSRLFRGDAAVGSWLAALPASLRWSVDGYRRQRALGQGRAFVAMHMLLCSARCVAHQAYLPQRDGFTIRLDSVDAAGWSFLHRSTALIATCVANAMAVGDMLTSLTAGEDEDEDDDEKNDDVQSIWVAVSVLCAANTFFWLLYAGDATFATPDNQEKARTYVRLICRLMRAWQTRWTVAAQWHHAVSAMHAMYRAAYLGDVACGTATPGASSAEGEGKGEEEQESDYRPQPGDGYPSLDDFPDLQTSLRLVSMDASAKPLHVPSVWAQLFSGWPRDPAFSA